MRLPTSPSPDIAWRTKIVWTPGFWPICRIDCWAAHAAIQMAILALTSPRMHPGVYVAAPAAIQMAESAYGPPNLATAGNAGLHSPQAVRCKRHVVTGAHARGQRGGALNLIASDSVEGLGAFIGEERVAHNYPAPPDAQWGNSPRPPPRSRVRRIFLTLI